MFGNGQTSPRPPKTSVGGLKKDVTTVWNEGLNGVVYFAPGWTVFRFRGSQWRPGFRDTGRENPDDCREGGSGPTGD